MTRYIFVIGGPCSSIGKGVITGSLGYALQTRGLSVNAIKIDPYLNMDAGTLNPYEHGECYVTDDGCETDLDLGTYERFLNISTSRNNIITGGAVFSSVLCSERRGEYLGKTVQISPHVVGEIVRRIKVFNGLYDVVLVEIGGTVGETENVCMLKAVKAFCKEERPLILFVTMLPVWNKEFKTKPAQQSLEQLQHFGISPDFIICRTEDSSLEIPRHKFHEYCNAVYHVPNVQSIYHVPTLLHSQGLDDAILARWLLPSLKTFRAFPIPSVSKHVTIGIIGKYTALHDSYKSIIEALHHVCSPHIVFFDSEGRLDALNALDGLIIAPGFGVRGVSGKIKAIEYARKNNVPCLGICFGFQLMAIEYARNVLHWTDADSQELNPETTQPIVTLIAQNELKGGTMRKGAKEVIIAEKSRAYGVYGSNRASERHRHRYKIDASVAFPSLMLSGVAGEILEILEIPHHKFFIGTAFHPEYSSRPLRPHPLFQAFASASFGETAPDTQAMV